LKRVSLSFSQGDTDAKIINNIGTYMFDVIGKENTV